MDEFKEQHRYDLPPKSQEGSSPGINPTSPTDIKIQQNDSVNPTALSTESVENHNDKANTAFSDSADNDQMDMSAPSESAISNKRYSGLNNLDDFLMKYDT